MIVDLVIEGEMKGCFIVSDSPLKFVWSLRQQIGRKDSARAPRGMIRHLPGDGDWARSNESSGQVQGCKYGSKDVWQRHSSHTGFVSTDIQLCICALTKRERGRSAWQVDIQA